MTPQDPASVLARVRAEVAASGNDTDWEGRVRAAEAKLAALRDLIGNPGWATPAEIQRKALAIIGSEGTTPFSATCIGPDCGEQFADSETGEYEFATRERMVMLLRADGWQADPVLCPACQPEGASS